MNVNCCVGIDLGSTTTKAVILDEEGAVLGRGITNSRSNYTVACSVALAEGLINARFGLIDGALRREGVAAPGRAARLAGLERGFREQQYRLQLKALGRAIHSFCGDTGTTEAILDRMQAETPGLFSEKASRKSEFFRDLAGSRYTHHAEEIARSRGLAFDAVVGWFDRAILDVENRRPEEGEFAACVEAAVSSGSGGPADADDRAALERCVRRAAGVDLKPARTVGTGYGRATLP
ncbi:MAG TPA: BadF/BadG/BcrA/BcrD ATPase family protein, partial [Candidatus Polarisedimenticolia bacterium]|nr:BadF/BadG/BcrA/BcrD ATPase family protein [Candidatus Polarisedimenticolia bacterium]